ncbi:MAG: DUF4124 domain-containing protein [Tahibacter sp.]
MKIRYLLIGLLAAASTTGYAAEKVYKWTDANGIVHYSDAPPPQGVVFENVRVVGQSTPVTAAGDNTNGAAATDGNQVSAAPGTVGTKRCEEARARVNLLSSKLELATKSDDGKTVAMDKSQRDAELNIAKATVQSLCPAETATR